jgi:hypothetical protein
MRLVDREQRGRARRHQRPEPLARRPFGRDVEEVELSVTIGLARVGEIGIDAGQTGGANPRRTRTAQLIMHQRDQRRYDDDTAVERHGGKLVGQRLARPRRHHRQRMRARHHPPDDIGLAPAKGVETESGFEKREKSIGGHRSGR